MNYALSTEPIRREGCRQYLQPADADETENADVDNAKTAKQQRLGVDTADALAPDIELTRHPVTSSADVVVQSKDCDALDVRPSSNTSSRGSRTPPRDGRGSEWIKSWRAGISRRMRRARSILLKYATFIGPGFMVAVAYIDPGMPPSYSHLMSRR
jgi:hypothetical protein